MSANTFKIWDKVDGLYEVERTATIITGCNSSILQWRKIEEGPEVLTLNEILEQVKKVKMDSIPFIRVDYSSALWGVIFETGNYPEMGNKWIVHGITKGYA